MTVAFSDHDLPSLPDNWRWIPLCEVATIGSRQVLPFETPEKSFNYLALENIESGTGQIINFSPILGKQIKSNKFLFDREHVLYGKLRPYLRKVVTPDFDGVSATDLLPIKPDNSRLDRHYLKWWLLSPVILDYVTGRQTGVKMPRLRSDDLDRLPIPLPPVEEQELIVDKLASLNAQACTIRAALDRIPALLKAFRQSVLAAAFRGELTERDLNDEPAAVLLERIRAERRRRWEESLRGKGKDPAKAVYEEPSAPDTSTLPELPEGWIWVRFEELLDELKNGYFSKAPQSEPPGVPVLRISAVRPFQVNVSDTKYLRDVGDVSEYFLREKDLLFTRYNGSLDLVGVCGVVRGLSEPLIYPDKLIRARLFSGVSSEYLEIYFASQLPRRLIEIKAKSSAGQTGIAGGDIKNLPVILPPMEEQERIVKKVKNIFRNQKLMEKSVEETTHRLEELEQSALAKAFRGEL